MADGEPLGMLTALFPFIVLPMLIYCCKKGGDDDDNEISRKAVRKPGAPPAPPGMPMAPTKCGMADTYDPNYQTLAGVGGEVFGEDKKVAGGGAAPMGSAPAPGGIVQPPQLPRPPDKGGIAGTYDPNYQTMAGLDQDIFQKNAVPGIPGVAPAAPVAPPAPPRPPEKGGIAGTYDPNYQTLAGLDQDVFVK